MRCRDCHEENPSEARFSLGCGAAITIACAGCGTTLPARARFCSACGQAVDPRPPASYTPRHLRYQIASQRGAIEGERKQVSVLFCDIVRSTALGLEVGPERLHGILDRFFTVALEEVHRYEGTVNQFLGDGFMALFGAPIAHEDHARRAIVAALAIRERVDLELRLGINTGQVVVGAIGDDLRMDYTAFGDVTIHAARLQAAAQPDDVLVTQATAEIVAGYFDFEVLPPVTVKERTLWPLRVTGPGTRTSPVDERIGLTPFSGRERELAALREQLDGVAAGDGQIVGVSGDAGLGKSRLVYEFCRAAAGETTVLEGRCLSYGRAMPYTPVLDVVRKACGLGLGDAPEQAVSKVGLTLAALELDREHGRYLLHALGLGAPADLEGVDVSMIMRRTFDAVRELLLAEARRRPLVLLIEDLHWIDPTSHQVLLELSAIVPSAPILLLATYRPTYEAPWQHAECASEIALVALPPTESERLVQWVLGDAERDVAPIVSRGEGNPFFLEELARAERDAVGGAVPGSVQDVLAARIDGLDNAQKDAVRLAGVLGREFSLELAEAVWDGGVQLAPLLQELVDLDFLREQRRPDGLAFRFKHALTRDVAYEGLLEWRRHEVHERAGQAIERLHPERLHEHYELLAYHYAHSANRERAADYLELANRKAISRYGVEEALEYFNQALEILEQLPDTDANRRRRLSLVVDQTPVFHYTRRNLEFHDLLLRHEPLALELGDPTLIGALYARLSHRVLISGAYRTALDIAGRALAAADEGGDAESAILASTIEQWALMFLGDFPRSMQACEATRARLAVDFYPMWHMYAEGALGMTHMMAGRFDEALQAFAAGIAKGEELSDSGTISWSKTFASWVCLERRDWAQAFELARQAVELAPTVYFHGYADGFYADAQCHMGAMDEGLPLLEHFLPLIRALRHELAWAIVAWRLALAYLAADRRQEAHEVLVDLLATTTRDGALFFVGASQRALAELALAEGNTTEAMHLVGQAIDVLRATGCENELALAIAALGRIERALGHEESARAHLQEALAALERLGTLEEPERLRRELEHGQDVGGRVPAPVR